MTRDTADIVVSGGGIAGLICVATLASAGFSVTLLDPTPPVLDATEIGADLRSTAFLQPARDLFEDIGIWDRLMPYGVALEALRIVDTVGQPPQYRDDRVFASSDMGDEPFGWNFLNSLTHREVLKHIQQLSKADLRFGVGFRSVLTRSNAAIVTLDDGNQIECRLLIGADGRNSPVREAAGIPVNTTRYGQKALAFTATHTQPHENISTEIYNEGGPFTAVPLNPIDGSPASAIVWMNAGRRALDLLEMPHELFEQEMTTRTAGILGSMSLASRRSIWPVITQTAKSITHQRIAIIAEAAHVLPPIGAQGLNTSINDIAALASAIKTAPDELGQSAMLARYEKIRATDINRRARIIDVFNRVTRSGGRSAQSLRLKGLQAAHDIVPIRRALMQAGLRPV